MPKQQFSSAARHDQAAGQGIKRRVFRFIMNVLTVHCYFCVFNTLYHYISQHTTCTCNMSQHTTLVNLLSSIHSLSTPGISIHSPAPGTQDPDNIASASASGASSHTSISSHSRRRHSSCAVWSPVSAQLHSLSGNRAPRRQLPGKFHVCQNSTRGLPCT